MNILYVSHVLGKRHLSEAVDRSSGIDYGRLILSTINAALPLGKRITADLTGDQLVAYFLTLPPDARAVLLGVEILSTSQSMDFSAAIKAMNVYANTQKDTVQSNIGYAGIAVSILAIVIMLALTANYLIMAPSYGLTINQDIVRHCQNAILWLWHLVAK